MFSNFFENRAVYEIILKNTSFRAGPSWSCSKAVYKPVWRITLLSVQWINSWWWTEELSETCRLSCQNKFVKLVHLVGFIIKKFVTMHGHVNVKKSLYKFPVRGRKCSSLAGNLTDFGLICSPSFLCSGLSHKSVTDFGYLAYWIPVMLADGMPVWVAVSLTWRWVTYVVSEIPF
jgi:hypothetical protein